MLKLKGTAGLLRAFNVLIYPVNLPKNANEALIIGPLVAGTHFGKQT